MLITSESILTSHLEQVHLAREGFGGAHGAVTFQTSVNGAVARALRHLEAVSRHLFFWMARSSESLHANCLVAVDIAAEWLHLGRLPGSTA